MRLLGQLLANDFTETIFWLRKETVSKLLVMLGFVGVMGSIVIISYILTSVFFRNLTTYQTYGILSATYLIHVGLIMLFFLVTALSTISFVVFLFSQRAKLESLMVLSLPSTTIPLWYFTKNVIGSLLLFFLFITPLMIAYQTYFIKADISIFLFVYSLLLIIVSLATTTLGMLLGFVICYFLPKKRGVTIVSSIAVALGLSFGLFQVVFPTTLKTLYNAPTETFFSVYQSLPLTQPSLPTLWLVESLQQGDVGFLLLFLVAVVLTALLVHMLIAHNFSLLFMRLYERPFRVLKNASRRPSGMLTTSMPLLQKDWLSIVRVPQELGYAGFLYLLLFPIFLFLLYSPRLTSQAMLSPNILIFAFLSYVFFSLAYMLRIIFPLMAREGKAAWFIFTVPLAKTTLLHQKILLALLLVVPHLSFSVVMWLVLGGIYSTTFIVFSTVLIMGLAVMLACLGAIHPNFREADSAERISTSTVGIAALLLALVISGEAAFFLSRILAGEGWYYFPVLGMITLSSMLTYFMAHEATDRYQF